MTIREEETDLDVEICDLSWQHIVARYWVQSENREIYSVIFVFRGSQLPSTGFSLRTKRFIPSFQILLLTYPL